MQQQKYCKPRKIQPKRSLARRQKKNLKKKRREKPKQKS
jgi:hypothetical protein